jgi:MOSC domain-containing protein YiiM
MKFELELRGDLMPSELSGTVRGLLVRPVKRRPVQLVDEWLTGDERDHGRLRGDRAVTLIAAEDMEAMSSTLGRPIDWSIARRNVLVSGVPLLVLIGRTFRLGEAVLEGARPCDPCAHMHRLYGADGYAAMVGRGGLCAKIVRPGLVRVGDTLELLASSALEA